MHEAGLTDSILEIVLRHAGSTQVLAVHLVIGELSSYVDESIQFYWDEIARDTPAEGSTLQFRREPGTLRCLDCEKDFSVREKDFTCSHCGSARALPSGGRDCYVESIEVAEEAP